ncbi:hypothetical protein MMC30_007560 [Trapelia coarctata]|nr:hypothetical protein [Trapelia coarctata]
MTDTGMLDRQRSPLAPSGLLPKSTNTSGESVSKPMKRLSLSTAASTALPPSSPISSPSALAPQHYNAADRSNLIKPTPYNRSTTSSSTERSFTPTLNKKTSLNSLQGSTGVNSPRSPVIRRVPSNLSNTTAMTSRSSLPPPAEEAQQPPPITAAQVAKSHFERELQADNKANPQLANPELMVILHDACYGHRFARPRTSKASLNTIVERPERIQATVLGISAAYVRLGGQHAQGIFPPGHATPLNSVHPKPFQIRKSSRVVSLVSPAATHVHGGKWMVELKMMCEGAEAKLALNGKELGRPTGLSDDKEDKPNLHEGDLYLCSESMNALEGALGGVCDAVDAVFDSTASKRAFVCVRPPGHHCSSDYPSGFCWLNNVHVGISYASITHGLTHAAIIDFDLHHGDGSQAITWAHNAKIAALPKNTPLHKKTAIGYFSLHDINSYPCEWGDEEKVQNASLCLENAHGQTIWNVHLQPWKSDLEFWELYNDRYSILLTKTRKFLENHRDKLRSSPHSPQPKAAIFISAGFDASEWESPGMQRHKVNVPTDFYARFTRDINAIADEEGLGVEGRVISVLEGGYSDRALTSGVLSHICGLSDSAEATVPLNTPNGLGLEMGRRLGRLSLDSTTADGMRSSSKTAVTVDPRWWALTNLEELEAVVNPPVPVTASKKARPVAPTYTTPTQSFTAKIVSPQANRRVSSSSAYRQRSTSSASSRPPTPPLPDVNWTVAAYELSKLLIPSDRQTESCKVEDLNAEATRVRRNRQSNIGLPVEIPANDARGMQLRDRRAKAPKMQAEDSRPASRADRRKTIAGDAIKLENGGPSARSNIGAVKAPLRRRVSVASTVLSATEDISQETDFGSLQRTETNSQTSATGDRPPSSLSARVAASSNPGGDFPLVKKTRAPPKAKLPTQGPPARKTSLQSTIPRVLSSALDKAKNAGTGTTSYPLPQPGNTTAQSTGPTNNQDVDQLAAGMKKMSIKLNLPSKEPKEKKSKPAPRQPRKTAPAKSTKKTSVDVLPQQSPPIFGGTQVPAVMGESVYHNPPILPSNEFVNDDRAKLEDSVGSPVAPPLQKAGENLPSTFMPPVSNSILTATADLPPPIMGQTTLGYPIAPSGYSLVQQPSEPHSSPVPPPPAPSTPKRTKKDLPVFTATSPIIFGQPSLGANGFNQALTFDVPKAPETTFGRTGDVLGAGAADAFSSPSRIEGVKLEEEQMPQKHEGDVWSIPDTPQPRLT